MTLNIATLREQIVDAAVTAVNATAENTAIRARDKAPVRKVFSGGRQTVRFKSAAEIEADRGLREKLGLAPEILATPAAIAAVRASGRNPLKATHIGGKEFGFARTIEAPGRTHSVHQDHVFETPTSGGSYAYHQNKTHTDRPRNLRNRPNAFGPSHLERLVDTLDYARLRTDEAEARLTSRGRYELASKRALTSRVSVNRDTGRPEITNVRVGGALRDSIHVERASVAQYPVIKASVVAGGKTAPYAKFQELGTRHNPAHPFLRPALAVAKDELPGAVLRALSRILGGSRR